MKYELVEKSDDIVFCHRLFQEVFAYQHVLLKQKNANNNELKLQARGKAKKNIVNFKSPNRRSRIKIVISADAFWLILIAQIFLFVGGSIWSDQFVLPDSSILQIWHLFSPLSVQLH